MGKKYSGYTPDTAKNLLLNAGAWCKNVDIDEDGTIEEFESAVIGGKLLGATREGGAFNAVPSVRQIEVDGVSGRAKGLEALDDWDINMSANVLEIKKETLNAALCGSVVDDSLDDYDIIQAKNHIELTDYIDNIAWYGTLSGSDKPVIIVIENALNTDGLALETKDKGEAVIAMTFYAHYDGEDLDHPPFRIYYPKN